jgi:hypothetical protein
LNKINLLEEQLNASKQVSDMVRSPTSSSSQQSDSAAATLASIEVDLGLAVQEFKDFLVAYKVDFYGMTD